MLTETNLTPFKYKQSIQIPDNFSSIPDYEYIMCLISKGSIREIEIDILKLLAQYKTMTSSQIRRMLGFDTYDKRLRKKLVIMKNNRILFRYSWTMDDGKISVMKGFCLDVMGYKLIKDYLGMNNIEWKMEDNLKPIELLFSRFIFNEIAIRAKDSSNYVTSYSTDNHIGTGVIIMNSASGNKPFVFLCIRKSNSWNIKFRESFGNIISFLNNGWQSFYSVKPLFIIVGEDEEHILSISDIITELTGDINVVSKYGVKFTTDDFIVQYPLSEAFANIDIIDSHPIINRVLAKIFE